MTATVRLLAPGDGPTSSAFASALQSRTGTALQFLDPPPADEAGWHEAMTAACASAPCSAETIDALRATQDRLGCGPRAIDSVRALGEPGTLAVVTGQQPGLFGGPLLTAHKIAGAIHLAQQLDGIGGMRVVPVYWAATEDHDLDEANRATVLDRASVPHTLQVDAQGDGRSIGHLPIDTAAVQAAVAQLSASLPDTPRGKEAVALAQPEPGDDYAFAAMRAVVRLFGDSGLVVADPLALQTASAATYDLLLANARVIDEAIRVRGAALREAQLPAPLEFPEGTAPLFLREAEGTRRLRVRVGDGANPTVWLRDQEAGTLTELRARVQQNPALASGNVVGRVFVQNALFPVLAYIAGPTEIAYQAQVREAYRALSLRFPLALPRPHATWVDAKTARRAQRFGLTPESILRGATPPPVSTGAEELLEQVEAHLHAWPQAVQRALDDAGPGAAALSSALDRVQGAWSKAAPRVRAGYEAAQGVGNAQWARLADVLVPRNRPQDRVLSPVSFVARFGVDAIREGLSQLDPLQAGHYLVDPEGEVDA